MLLIAKLDNSTVSITAPQIVVSITYPFNWMAVNAYYNIRECCERFNKEVKLEPDDLPKIYAFGEMHTWPSYMKKLCLTAEKIGAKISLKSINE